MSDIKCVICKKRMREGEKVIPVMQVVGNNNRGDFIRTARDYVHLKHLTDGVAPPQDECKHTHVQPYTQSDQRPWCVSCGLFVTVIGKEAGR